jgi:hypothetical protein
MRFPTRVWASAAVWTFAAILLSTTPAFAGNFKVAYWNVKSGKGAIALPGHPSTFADTSNCTDPTQPENAWGIGLVQHTLLTQIQSDPSIVALGLGEAWTTVCGSPENIRTALGWPARTVENNGVAIIARYGFAGPPVWQQLDTSLTASPTDTMWVVRTPVCLNAACTSSLTVFTAHWGGGSDPEYDIQAQQTAAFMTKTAGTTPHVLIGDLNVWEGTGIVCSQTPQNTALNYLRADGYTDTWPTVNGSVEGYTGMANRAGCGVPVGYTWKRIDYAWYKNLVPVSMTRFGMTTPGDGSPSDHYGIIAEYEQPGLPVDVTPPVAAITSPTERAVVSGSVTVGIAASDDRAVSRVDLLVDDVMVGTTTSTPYAIAWNTSAIVNGVHNLVARAHDPSGNVGESAVVAVTVDNASSGTVDVVLIDDHFDVLNRSVWTSGPFTSSADTGVAISDSGGMLQTGPLKASISGSHYNGVSTSTCDLSAGGYAYVQLTQAPNPIAQGYAMFAAGSDGNNFYRVYVSANTLVAEKKIAGIKKTLMTVAYDASASFVRIRYDASADQVVFETATADGAVPGAFTLLYREAWDSHVATAAMRFELKGGTSNAIANPGTVLWDNFRSVHAVPALE